MTGVWEIDQNQKWLPIFHSGQLVVLSLGMMIEVKPNLHLFDKKKGKELKILNIDNSSGEIWYKQKQRKEGFLERTELQIFKGAGDVNIKEKIFCF